MLEIGAFEAKNTLGSLLDRVEAGEEIRITRHGKPVARLIPDIPIRISRSQAAAKKIRGMAKSRKAGSFDWEEWKSYRDEGRR